MFKKSLFFVSLLLALFIVTSGFATVIDQSPVKIESSPKSATFTLVVEDLPKTFLYSQKSTRDNSREYNYSISFYDGTNLFDIGSRYFKGNAIAEFEGGLESMQHNLWLADLVDGSSSMVTNCDAKIKNNAIVWTLSKPIVDRDGKEITIDFDNIVLWGYEYSSPGSDAVYAFYQVQEDGSTEELDIRILRQAIPIE